MTSVLFLGATGYIGGAALVALSRDHPNIIFTAVIRSETHSSVVAETGALVIVDPITDLDALSTKVSEFDIVVNCASSRDVPLTTAILKGLKIRFENGKGVGALIHTSGAANFLDFNKEGKFDPNAKIWTDSEEDVKQIHPQLFHGNVDVPILKAGEEGYVNTFIIAPPGVFGRGSGPVGKASLFILSKYVGQGKVTYVGEGSNLCSTVHIDDLIDLYRLVFNRALEASGKKLPESPYSTYYVPTSGELTYKSIAGAYAKALYAKGVVSGPDAVGTPLDQAGPMAIAWSSNMYVKTIQTKGLGWAPKHAVTEEDVIDGLEDGLSRMQK